MAKFGIGVGEEFPVDDAKTPPTPPPDPGDDRRERRHHWRRHRFLHVLTRVALFALIVSAIAWLFRPHYFYGPYAPYAFHPYPHHVFFPFFPVLLIGLLVAFAWRRGGCYGMRRHWHDRPRGGNTGEGA